MLESNATKLFNLLAKMIYHYEMSPNKDRVISIYKANRVDANIKKYKNQIKNKFEDFEHQIEMLLSQNSINALNEIILYIVACDQLIEINDYKVIVESEENWLNNDLQDAIKIFVSFNTKKDYKHSASTCLSSFLNNIVYVLVNQVNVKSIYVFDTSNLMKLDIKNQDNDVEEEISIGREFKLACVSYGLANTELSSESNHTLKFSPVKKRNKKLDERLLRSYEDAVNNGALLVFGAEMTGSTSIDEKLTDYFRKSSVESIIWTPPYHYDIENGESVSQSLLLNPYNKRKTYVKKVVPYNGPISELETYPMEDIVPGEYFVVLHIQNVGRVLLLICSDFFHSQMDNLISNMRIDIVLLASYTSQDYGKFNDDAASFIKSDRRTLLQCNNCLQMKKEIKKIKKSLPRSSNMEQIKVGYFEKGLQPFNIITKDIKEVKKKAEKVIINGPFPCDCKEQCLKKEVCYFMFTFVIEQDRISLKSIDYITRRNENEQ